MKTNPEYFGNAKRVGRDKTFEEQLRWNHGLTSFWDVGLFYCLGFAVSTKILWNILEEKMIVRLPDGSERKYDSEKTVKRINS